jgi:DNA-binding CsgD family transcriptional regulator
MLEQSQHGVAAALHDRTAGNPLFVEELHLHLAEQPTGWSGGVGEEVPAAVRLLVELRLRRLASETRQVLAAAAVLHRSTDLETLSSVTGLSAAAVTDAVDEAARARFTAATGFAFRHEIVRQALQAGLTPARRRELHRRTARALRATHAACLDEVAGEMVHHLTLAGPPVDRAEMLYWLRISHDRAMAAAAFEDALRFADTALALDAADADLLTRRAAALRSLGRWDEALSTWLAGVEGLTRRGEEAVLPQLCAQMAGHLLWAGRHDECTAVVRRGIDASSREESVARVLLLSYGGRDAAFRRDYEGGERFTADGVQLAERLAMPVPRAVALFARAVHHYAWTEPREAMRCARAAEALATSSLARWELTDGLGFALLAAIMAGDLVEADRIARRLEPMAERLAHSGAATTVCRWRILERAAAGDLSGAEAAAADHLRLNRRSSMPFRSDSLVWRGLVAFWRGDWDTAAAALDQAAANEKPDSATTGAPLGLSFLLAAYRGDRTACSALLPRLAAVRPRHGEPTGIGRWTCLLAEVEGRALLGDSHTADLYPLVQQVIDAGVVLRGYDSRLVHTIAGLCAAAGRRWSVAERHFTVAIDTADRLPHQVERLDARRWYAHALAMRDTAADHARAGDLLQEALTGYERLGMARHAELAMKMTDRLHPDRSTIGLTPREEEILSMLAAGQTNREIAADLVIALATVNRHIANIYGKIGARNRAEATAFALGRRRRGN